MLHIPKILNIKITGTGSYLPEQKETVDDFLKKGVPQKFLDEVGIIEHRVIGNNETVTDMEAKAAKIAINKAGITPNDIDLIIGVTAVSEEINPQNVCRTQQKINALNAAVIQMDLSCCGPIHAMVVAANFIALGQYKNILLVGSSNSTTVSGSKDPASFVVLGDGASAIIMTKADNKNQGILSFDLETKGQYFDYCGVKPQHDDPDKKPLFFIDEKALTQASDSSGLQRYLVSSVPKSVNRAIKKAEIKGSDIDLLVPHQNNKILGQKWVDTLLKKGIKNAHTTYQKYGNMSAANIWVNLDEALKENKIKEGDIIAFTGQGSGFHVGSVIMRW